MAAQNISIDCFSQGRIQELKQEKEYRLLPTSSEPIGNRRPCRKWSPQRPCRKARAACGRRDIVEDRNLGDDGKWNTQRGVHWGWILGGRAVQDVWMSYNVKSGEQRPYGTTVLRPEDRCVAQRVDFSSSGCHEKIPRQESPRRHCLRGNRWKKDVKEIFSEFTSNSFRWHSEVSDDGKTWSLTEAMCIMERT